MISSDGVCVYDQVFGGKFNTFDWEMVFCLLIKVFTWITGKAIIIFYNFILVCDMKTVL